MGRESAADWAAETRPHCGLKLHLFTSHVYKQLLTKALPCVHADVRTCEDIVYIWNAVFSFF